MPQRIVFTGDIFRTAGHLRPDQIWNVQWLQKQFGGLLESITGLPSEIRFWGKEQSPDIIARAFDSLGEEISYDAWARNFWKTATADLSEVFYDDYRDALVVAIEASPLVESILNNVGADWINIQISPLRFLSDWALSIRGSKKICFESVSRFSLSDTDILNAVTKVKEYYGDRNYGLNDALLFCGQMSGDRSLIGANGFVQPAAVVDHLLRVSENKKIFIKPHPLEKDNEIIRAITSSVDVSFIEGDIYGILSSRESFSVAAISSSVLSEARAFDKKTHVFLEKINAGLLPAIVVLSGYWNPEFWSGLLQLVCPCNSSIRFPIPEHTLRSYQALGQDIEKLWPYPPLN